MKRFLSLKDHVYNYISERINNGTLKPDDKINEQQICEELGVSRTPIREALIQLASDGYLDTLPRRGFRVKYLSVRKAQELYDIIGTLDAHAAVISMDQLQPEDLRKMRELAEDMETAIKRGQSNQYHELQVQFHDVYLDRCGNEELPLLLEHVKNNFLRKYYLFEDPENEMAALEEANRQHFEIIRLFEEKNGSELERFIREVHWNPEEAKFDSLEKQN